MLYLKILLAVILSTLPFLYAYYTRTNQKSSSKYRNLFTLIEAQFPMLIIIRRNLKKVVLRIYEGMKKSDNFRKFFTRITLLVIITFQFVDFHASTVVANMTQQCMTDGEQTAEIMCIYGSLMTCPQATFFAACIGFSLFFFKAANWLLTALHNDRKIYGFTALVSLVVIFASTRYFIVGETLEIILLAAYFYPNKIGQKEPKGGLHLPKNYEQQPIKLAA